MGQTVVVGMSGGVDSSVAAMLLKEQGYEVIGLFMHNWEEEDENGVCRSESDFADVRKVCGVLRIPYYSVNFAADYREKVFKLFLEEYKAGRTPNPDVLCNREIKFGPFLQYAKKLGADYIATGHYCKRATDDAGVYYYLKKAVDTDKDQTYFLCQLNQEQLGAVLFPLADLKKKEVRALAAARGLPVADKKDSTGICFIGERKFKEFLSKYLPAQKGEIKTVSGVTVGEHDGVQYYTVGQSRGLNMGGKSGFAASKWFVVGKDIKNNVLTVAQSGDGALFKRELTVRDINWIPAPPREKEFCRAVKIRYRQTEQAANVKITGADSAFVTFDKPQRAVTAGQYAVFYDEDYCLGGGVIL